MAEENHPDINVISTSTLGTRNIDPDSNRNMNMNTNTNTTNINTNVNLMRNLFHEFSPNARNFNENPDTRRDCGSQRGRSMFDVFYILYMYCL